MLEHEMVFGDALQKTIETISQRATGSKTKTGYVAAINYLRGVRLLIFNIGGLTDTEIRLNNAIIKMESILNQT